MKDIKHIRTFLLDMDGTVTLGNQLLPGARKFFQTLDRQHKSYFFLTNNSSTSALSYWQKLRRLGLDGIAPDQIITSGQCTAWFLSKAHPQARVFLLGTRQLELEFLRFGLILVQERPDFVVLGYDKTLTWSKLEQACTFIREKRPFFATHPDLNCPTEHGPVIDAGSLIKAIEASTGISPQIMGKPSQNMIDYALFRSDSSPSHTAVMGDRLYTDIAMGNLANIASILVLTGETGPADLDGTPWHPDWVFPSLQEIEQAIGGASLEPDQGS